MSTYQRVIGIVLINLDGATSKDVPQKFFLTILLIRLVIALVRECNASWHSNGVKARHLHLELALSFLHKDLKQQFTLNFCLICILC